MLFLLYYCFLLHVVLPGGFSVEKIGTPKGRKLFFLIALAGNIIGLLLTCTRGGGQIYSDGFEIRKEEDSYEEKLEVSVEGEKEGNIYVQVPEKVSEKESSQEEAVLNEKTKMQQKLLEYIEKYNSQKDNPDVYYLPADWNGKHLEWMTPYDNTGTFMSALMIIAAFAIIVISMREEQKKRIKRYEELMMDYPGIIMKFTLLVQAGMTVRNAFRKMAVDYKRKEEKRIAYGKKL